MLSCQTNDKEEINEPIVYNNILYLLHSDGTCTVSSNPTVSGEVVIPQLITYKKRNYMVRAISDHAFEKCRLTKIVLPSSLVSIGDYAFAGCNFSSTEFDMKNRLSLRSIGAYAFSNTSGVLNFALDNCSSLSSIGDGAFQNSSVVDISFAGCNSLSVLGNTIFSGCKRLKIIDLENTLIEIIPAKAFNDDSALEEITFPKNLQTIKSGAFMGCNSLSEINCYVTTPPVCGEDSFDRSRMSEILVFVDESDFPNYQSNSFWNRFKLITEELSFLDYEVHKERIVNGSVNYFYKSNIDKNSIGFTADEGIYWSWGNCEAVGKGPVVSLTQTSLDIDVTSSAYAYTIMNRNMDPGMGYYLIGKFSYYDRKGNLVTKWVDFYAAFTNFQYNVENGYHNPEYVVYQRIRSEI